ncbi:GAS2-like protein 3 isoform X1 [Hydra vulgaris]|uniref:GAS2-like protein 3 isoform X1 n=1 Tax=Hydra vulgaris TaxID=6087 RepID=UPI001F5E86E3|nr:GAS2-like protein 3 [Hydra vulgaris]
MDSALENPVYQVKDRLFSAHPSSFHNDFFEEPKEDIQFISSPSSFLRHANESQNETLKRRERRKGVISSPISPNFIKQVEVPEKLTYRESGLKKLKSGSLESIARWEKENEFLFTLIEDECDWLSRLFPDEKIDSSNFFQYLEDGVLLCKLSKLCQNYSDDCARRNKVPFRTFNIVIHPRIKCRGKIGQFMSRENVELFLKWCRYHGIPEPILFESNDVVEKTDQDGLREGAREIVLCLMEVARLGVKWGVEPPKLIQLEQEIEREESFDAASDESGSTISVDSGFDAIDFDNNMSATEKINASETEEKKQKQTSDINISKSSVNKSDLHNMVTSLIEAYQIQKATRLKEGKYIILGRVMFVRLLNNHCIVRVGGGWDTLEHYLMTHLSSAIDPTSFEKSSDHSSPASSIETSRKKSFFKSKKSLLTKSTPNLQNIFADVEFADISRTPPHLFSPPDSRPPCSKDPYIEIKKKKLYDDRKISQAILRVSVDVSNMKKAASLDWTQKTFDKWRQSSFESSSQNEINIVPAVEKNGIIPKVISSETLSEKDLSQDFTEISLKNELEKELESYSITSLSPLKEEHSNNNETMNCKHDCKQTINCKDSNDTSSPSVSTNHKINKENSESAVTPKKNDTKKEATVAQKSKIGSPLSINSKKSSPLSTSSKPLSNSITKSNKPITKNTLTLRKSLSTSSLLEKNSSKPFDKQSLRTDKTKSIMDNTRKKSATSSISNLSNRSPTQFKKPNGASNLGNEEKQQRIKVSEKNRYETLSLAKAKFSVTKNKPNEDTAKSLLVKPLKKSEKTLPLPKSKLSIARKTSNDNEVTAKNILVKPFLV